jgi:hypothetical protein
MMLGLASGSVDARASVAPRAVIKRLLLAPEQAGIGILIKVGRDKVIGEGRDLLNAADGDVLNATLLTGLEEGKVNLTRAKNVAFDVFGSDKALVGLGDVALEVGITNHFIEVGARLGVTKQTLREEEDERLAEVAVDLATEDVEVVGRGTEKISATGTDIG